MDDMFERIIAGGESVFYRHLQKDEEDLDDAEKRDVLNELFDQNKLLFVQRYARYLDECDCVLFDSAKSDPVVSCLLAQISRKVDAGKRNVRNRRYVSMLSMKAKGSYFSDEKMREREPYLYDQMIGQHLSEEERLELRPSVSVSEEEKRRAEGGGWSGLLSQFEQSGETAQRRQWQNEEWDASSSNDKHSRFLAHVNRAMEMEEEGEELEVEGSEEENGASMKSLRKEVNDIASEMAIESAAVLEEEGEDVSVGKEQLRSEFVALMEERFLAGLDSRFFDYSAVDNDDRLDEEDAIAEREREEKWFEEEEGGELSCV